MKPLQTLTSIISLCFFLASCDTAFEKVTTDAPFAGIQEILDRQDGTYTLVWQPYAEAKEPPSYAIFMRHDNGAYDFENPVSTTLSTNFQTENLRFHDTPCFIVRISLSGLEDKNTNEKCITDQKLAFTGIEDAIYQEDGSYLITWNGANESDIGFEIFIREDGKDFQWNRPDLKSKGTEKITTETYKMGQKICFNVRAVNPTTGKRLEENTKEVCKDGIKEGQEVFAGIETAVALHNGSVEISWPKTGAGVEAAGFHVYSDSLFTQKVGVMEPGVYKTTITDLVAGSSYNFGVRYFTAGGIEDANTKTISVTIPNNKAPQFKGISDAFLDTASKTLTVKWTMPEDAVEKFSIYLGTSQRSATVDSLVCEEPANYDACRSQISFSLEFASAKGTEHQAVIPLTGHPVHGLPDDYAYFVAVRATGFNGIEDNNSVTKKVVTENNDGPKFEGILNASRFDNGVKLTWKKPHGEVSSFKIFGSLFSGDILYTKKSLIASEPVEYAQIDASLGKEIVTETFIEGSTLALDSNSNGTFDSATDLVGFRSGNIYKFKVLAIDRYGNFINNQIEATVSFNDTLSPIITTTISPGYSIDIGVTDNASHRDKISVNLYKKESASPTDFPLASDDPILTTKGDASVAGDCVGASTAYHNYYIVATDESGNSSVKTSSVKCDNQTPPVGYITIPPSLSGLSYTYHIMESQAQSSPSGANEMASCLTPNTVSCLNEIHRHAGTSKFDNAACGCNPKTDANLSLYKASISKDVTPAKTTAHTAQAACFNASTDEYIVRPPTFHEMKMASRWHGGSLTSYIDALGGCQMPAANSDFIASEYSSCKTPHGLMMFTGGRQEYLLGTDLTTFGDASQRETKQSDAGHHMDFDLDKIGYYHWTDGGNELLWDLSSRYQVQEQTAGLDTRGFRCVAILRSQSPHHDNRALPYDPATKGLSVVKGASSTALSWNPKIKQICADPDCLSYSSSDTMTYKIYRFEVGKAALETHGIQPLWIFNTAHPQGGYPIDALALDSAGEPLYSSSSSYGKMIATITNCNTTDTGNCVYTDHPANGDGYIAGRSYFYSMVTEDQNGNKVQDIWSGHLFEWNNAAMDALVRADQIVTGADGVETDGDRPNLLSLWGGLLPLTDEDGFLYAIPSEYPSSYRNEAWRLNPNNFKWTRIRGDNKNSPTEKVLQDNGGWDPANTPGGDTNTNFILVKNKQLVRVGGRYTWTDASTLAEPTQKSGMWVLEANPNSPNYTYYKKAMPDDPDFDCETKLPGARSVAGWTTSDNRLFLLNGYGQRCWDGSVRTFSQMWQFTPTNPADYGEGGEWVNKMYGPGGSNIRYFDGFSHEQLPSTFGHVYSDSMFTHRGGFTSGSNGTSSLSPTNDGLRAYSYSDRNRGDTPMELWYYDANQNRMILEYQVSEPQSHKTFRTFSLENHPPHTGFNVDAGQDRNFEIYADKYDRIWLFGRASSELWVYDLNIKRWMLFSGNGHCANTHYVEAPACPEIGYKKAHKEPSKGAWPLLHQAALKTSIDHNRGRFWITHLIHFNRRRHPTTGAIQVAHVLFHIKLSMEEDGYH